MRPTYIHVTNLDLLRETAKYIAIATGIIDKVSIYVDNIYVS